MSKVKEPSKPFEIRTRGDPKNPPVVIFVGTGVSCNNALVDDDLAARGFFAVTFNMRDVIGGALEKEWDGEHDWNAEMMKAFDPSNEGGFEAPYSFVDQASDYVRVLDQLQLSKASILGFSTGGTIAQIAMVRHPDRVDKAVLCATGFDPDTWGQKEVPAELLAVEERVKAKLAAAGTLTPESTKEDLIRQRIAMLGTMMEFPEDGEDPRQPDLVARTEADWAAGWYDKGSGNPRSALAYAQWKKEGGKAAHHAALKHNTVPCLYVHGRMDPMVRYEDNAPLLLAATANASLLTHDHGHILGPPDSHEALLDRIAAFLKTGVLADA